MKSAELKVLPVSVLKPAEYNPRKKLKPGDKEYEKIKNSIEEFGFADYRLVVNRVRPRMIAKNYMPNIDDAMDMAGLPLLGIVPEDEEVLICGALGELLPERAPAAKAFANIAARLDAQEVPLMKLR